MPLVTFKSLLDYDNYLKWTVDVPCVPQFADVVITPDGYERMVISRRWRLAKINGKRTVKLTIQIGAVFGHHWREEIDYQRKARGAVKDTSKSGAAIAAQAPDPVPIVICNDRLPRDNDPGGWDSGMHFGGDR